MDFQESDRAWKDREAKVSASLELTVHCQVLIHDHCATDKHFLPDIPIGKNLHDWGPFLLLAAEISESRGFSYELSWDHLVPSMTWNPSASFPQISKLSRPPYLFQYSHPSPLLLLLYFHAWLSSKSISVFREQRYSDMTVQTQSSLHPKERMRRQGWADTQTAPCLCGSSRKCPWLLRLEPCSGSDLYPNLLGSEHWYPKQSKIQGPEPGGHTPGAFSFTGFTYTVANHSSSVRVAEGNMRFIWAEWIFLLPKSLMHPISETAETSSFCLDTSLSYVPGCWSMQGETDPFPQRTCFSTTCLSNVPYSGSVLSEA